MTGRVAFAEFSSKMDSRVMVFYSPAAQAERTIFDLMSDALAAAQRAGALPGNGPDAEGIGADCQRLRPKDPGARRRSCAASR